MNNKNIVKLNYNLLRCLACKSDLSLNESYLKCNNCSKEYRLASDGTPIMLPKGFKMRDDMDRKPSWLAKFVPSGKYPGINIGFQQHDFVNYVYEKLDEPLILNVESGGTDFEKPVINLDIYNGKNIDIVADGHFLPFENESIDALFCDSILEHVDNPWKMVDEFFRVLKTGGFIYVVVPFIFPYHESPIDCWRFTTDGLKRLLGSFETIKSGYLKGPVSTYARITAEFFAIVLSFNIPILRKVIDALSRIILHPLTYADYLFIKFDHASYVASGAYMLGKKPKNSPIEK